MLVSIVPLISAPFNHLCALRGCANVTNASVICQYGAE